MGTDSTKRFHLLTAQVKSGGCAAKLPALDLHNILQSLPKQFCPELLAGIDKFDDAAVYKISDETLVVQTVDFFPPLVDDPFLFGKVAATNALSDVYAMGARPILALNILGFPTCDLPLEVAQDILRGAAEQVLKAGAVVAGGHTIQSSELFYGLAVTGLVGSEALLTNHGATDGDTLVLTKPIGTGVALQGYRGQSLAAETRETLFACLTELNDKVISASRGIPIHAATDVTGFGLIGHLQQMALASGLSCRLNASSVPLLPEVFNLAGEGFIPAATYSNRASFQSYITTDTKVPLALVDLLFDPQTAGGLLLAIPANFTEQCLQRLKTIAQCASCIGQFQAGVPGQIEVAP